MHPVLGLALGYLAGSFPSAYLAGRALKGVDLELVPGEHYFETGGREDVAALLARWLVDRA